MICQSLLHAMLIVLVCHVYSSYNVLMNAKQTLSASQATKQIWVFLRQLAAALRSSTFGIAYY